MKYFFWILSFLFLLLSRTGLQRKRSLAFIYIIVLLVGWTGQSFGETQQRYSSKVSYSLNQVLHFRDFELEFLGMKTQRIEVNRHLIPTGPCYNFKISNKQESKVICWSSGTGDVAPIPFKVANQCFTLERVYSEKIPKISGKFKNLEENELVINKASPDGCRNAK